MKFIRFFSLTSLFIFFVNPDFLQAQIAKYPVSDIPANLLNNARAVVRDESFTLEIHSASAATLTHHVSITILNENAQPFAVIMEMHDKFNHIVNIHGSIYNESGKKIESVSNIEDYSAIPGMTLYDDNRVKYFEPKYRTYPFTVEYFIQSRMTGYNDFPAWFPSRGYNISVQKSSFRVVTPNLEDFRFYSSDKSLMPVKIINGKETTLTWSVENLPAVEEEPFARNFEEYIPAVHFAPNEFSIGGYPGDMTSWNAFGNWIKALNSGRNVLPPEKKAFILSMIRDCPTKYEKAKKIYEYFQQSTRYVSIQIGIGGWQPFEASVVDKMGYGDCKALSNYLKALYDAANINSYYTLVRAGADEPPIISAFPSQQFNHAILCMPIEEDTIWIECTNQRIPFGYNSTFTDDRDVLLINETGGHLVHTRIFDASVNYRKRNILISVTPDGNAGIKINTEYSGSFFDDHFSLIGADNERRKKMISEQFAISGLLLDSMDIKSTKSRLPALRERLTGSVPRYSNITGSRMLVQFNRLFDLPKPPKNVNNRKSAVYIRRSYTQQDSVQIMIPEDFSVESLPSDTVIISRFGECRYSYLQTDASHVRYCRVLTVRAGEYDAEQYKEFRGFVSSLSYHDGLKMCLKKKG